VKRLAKERAVEEANIAKVAPELGAKEKAQVKGTAKGKEGTAKGKGPRSSK
jgi:hypothetical protein